MFDFFYGDEPRQYAFYSIPQMLFTEPKFKKLSCEAKVLYGLLLDRAGLSVKNGWVDEENRVYVHFKREKVCEMLGCKKDKAMKILAELDEGMGIGLIKRVNVGQGKPAKIYIKHFAREAENKVNTDNENEGNTETEEKGELQNSEISKEKEQISEVGSDTKTDFLKSEIPTSGSRKNRPQEVDKNDPLPYKSNSLNQTLLSDYQSINQPSVAKPTSDLQQDRIDEIDYIEQIEFIREQVNSEYLLSLNNKNGMPCFEPEEVDELVELIAWVKLTSQPAIRINGDYIDMALVRLRFSKLNEEHIQYVLNCLSETTVKITQRRSYLLTCLYNAPSSMSGYTRNQVNHDMYGCV